MSNLCLVGRLRSDIPCTTLGKGESGGEQMKTREGNSALTACFLLPTQWFSSLVLKFLTFVTLWDPSGKNLFQGPLYKKEQEVEKTALEMSTSCNRLDSNITNIMIRI